MTQNISGFGLIVQVQASLTFPAGLTLTEFADDADPFDLPSLQVTDKAMGLNGDLLVWSKAVPIAITLNMWASGEDDTNLQILLEANRAARGKSIARDRITMTGIFPNGSYITLVDGVITNGMPGNSVASAARFKTKAYVFAFENKVSNQVF